MTLTSTIQPENTRPRITHSHPYYLNRFPLLRSPPSLLRKDPVASNRARRTVKWPHQKKPSGKQRQNPANPLPKLPRKKSRPRRRSAQYPQNRRSQNPPSPLRARPPQWSESRRDPSSLATTNFRSARVRPRAPHGAYSATTTKSERSTCKPRTAWSQPHRRSAVAKSL